MADHDEADLSTTVAPDPAKLSIAIRMVSGQKQVIIFFEAAFLIRLIVYFEIA